MTTFSDRKRYASAIINDIIRLKKTVIFQPIPFPW